MNVTITQDRNIGSSWRYVTFDAGRARYTVRASLDLSEIHTLHATSSTVATSIAKGTERYERVIAALRAELALNGTLAGAAS